jgi:hypothetical protein
MLSGSSDRKPPIVQKLFDPQDIFDILPLIYPMPGPRFFGGEIRKLGLPKAQNIGLHTYDFADF